MYHTEQVVLSCNVEVAHKYVWVRAVHLQFVNASPPNKSLLISWHVNLLLQVMCFETLSTFKMGMTECLRIADVI